MYRCVLRIPWLLDTALLHRSLRFSFVGRVFLVRFISFVNPQRGELLWPDSTSISESNCGYCFGALRWRAIVRSNSVRMVRHWEFAWHICMVLSRRVSHQHMKLGPIPNSPYHGANLHFQGFHPVLWCLYRTQWPLVSRTLLMLACGLAQCGLLEHSRN